jgi:hypothetical protein
MFFYVEQQVSPPVNNDPSYSFTPETLSFGSQGQTLTFDFTVTNGSMAENINITSDNPQFSVSPSSTGISLNDTVTVSVTFNGSNNTQTGVISVTGVNIGLIGTVSVNSSLYSGGGPIGAGDSGDPFGTP